MFASTNLSHSEEQQPLTVTVAQARKLSGLGLTKTYQLINSGALETTKIGSRTLITYRSLKKLLLPPESVPEVPRGRGRPRK